MPHEKAQRDEEVEAATELARDVAADLDAVLLTHYDDPETLDTFRPGETSIETVLAVNRAVAAEMIAQGVEVFVQRADRAAFRRWMREREDTPENRRGWIDRDRLLRGDAALRLIGLRPTAPTATKPRFERLPGPVADRLLAAFVAGEPDDLEALAEDLLLAGREDVLDLAIRKAAEHHGDENADELAGMLRSVAEGAAVGPSGWAELVALPVALAQGRPPAATLIGEGLIASGALADSLELRFLPLWRSPDAIAHLSPAASRRVLLELVAGVEPRDLPPADVDELAKGGFGVLVGLQIDWDIPVWDDIAAAEGRTAVPGEEDPGGAEATRAATLFDRWRGSIFEASGGCVPLALVAPSEVEAEIAEFLDEAGAQTLGLEEIVELIARARHEAGDEEVVCRLEITDEGLELSLYTARGRHLGDLSLPVDRLPARAVEMPQIIGRFVRVVRDAPGR
ncbi:hypothetical protein [Muricoccus radiodurans]|uniref:hypothetical protein n=1 Tax=Muricoccus radiodurans TaxID=2231721 RepID=UPI003CEB05A2